MKYDIFKVQIRYRLTSNILIFPISHTSYIPKLRLSKQVPIDTKNVNTYLINVNLLSTNIYDFNDNQWFYVVTLVTNSSYKFLGH